MVYTYTPGTVPYAEAPNATTPSTHPIYGSAGVPAPYHFDINGAPPQFAWRNHLNCALAFRRRMTRAPAQDPLQDNTIAIVKAHREQYIRLMVRAAYSMDIAKDNPEFDGVAMFTLGGDEMAAPQEVETMCRVLFQAIIDYCEEGRRGFPRAHPLLEKRRVRRKGQPTSVEG